MGAFVFFVIILGLIFWGGYWLGREKSKADIDVFKAHYALILSAEQDRAPSRYMVFPCKNCGEQIEYAIEPVRTGSGEIRANVDQTEANLHKIHCTKGIDKPSPHAVE